MNQLGNVDYHLSRIELRHQLLRPLARVRLELPKIVNRNVGLAATPVKLQALKVEAEIALRNALADFGYDFARPNFEVTSEYDDEDRVYFGLSLQNSAGTEYYGVDQRNTMQPPEYWQTVLDDPWNDLTAPEYQSVPVRYVIREGRKRSDTLDLWDPKELYKYRMAKNKNNQ